MVERALVTSAADREREKAPGDGVESFVSDAAQQLSAWACVTTLSELELGSVDPCIGQTLPEQQAMRASGVACQPAHCAHPAAPSVRATTSAAVRLNSSSTTFRMHGRYTSVNVWSTGQARGRRLACSCCPQRRQPDRDHRFLPQGDRLVGIADRLRRAASIGRPGSWNTSAAGAARAASAVLGARCSAAVASASRRTSGLAVAIIEGPLHARLGLGRGTEVVVTGAPRKRLVRKGTWVRIPPSPPLTFRCFSSANRTSQRETDSLRHSVTFARKCSTIRQILRPESAE